MSTCAVTVTWYILVQFSLVIASKPKYACTLLRYLPPIGFGFRFLLNFLQVPALSRRIKHFIIEIYRKFVAMSLHAELKIHVTISMLFYYECDYTLNRKSLICFVKTKPRGSQSVGKITQRGVRLVILYILPGIFTF